MPLRPAAAGVALLLLVAAGCVGRDAPDPPDATSTPAATPAAQPTASPTHDLAMGRDPCGLLATTQVAVIGGEPFRLIGRSGGAVLALCTFESEDGERTLDLAIVDLEQLAEAGDEMDGDAYVGALAEAAGDAPVRELEDVGDGRAIVISYPRGSQAWAWRDMLVYGAYATEVDEADRLAIALLQAELEGIRE